MEEATWRFHGGFVEVREARRRLLGGCVVRGKCLQGGLEVGFCWEMNVGRCLGGMVEVLDRGAWCSFFFVASGDVAYAGFGGVGWGCCGDALNVAGCDWMRVLVVS